MRTIRRHCLATKLRTLLRVISDTMRSRRQSKASTDDRHASFHHTLDSVSSPNRTTSVNKHTFAHSGTIVNDKGSDIFFVRHGESCFWWLLKKVLAYEHDDYYETIMTAIFLEPWMLPGPTMIPESTWVYAEPHSCQSCDPRAWLGDLGTSRQDPKSHAIDFQGIPRAFASQRKMIGGNGHSTANNDPLSGNEHLGDEFLNVYRPFCPVCMRRDPNLNWIGVKSCNRGGPSWG
jgi:hypothetical protein